MAERDQRSGQHQLRPSREREESNLQRSALAARLSAEAEQRARLDAERVEHARRLAERSARESVQTAQRIELSQLQSAQRAEFERAEAWPERVRSCNRSSIASELPGEPWRAL